MWSVSVRLVTLCLVVALTGCSHYAHTDNDFYGSGEPPYYDRDVDYSDAELQQMLAPIALYPDVLLSQILMASTYPSEVDAAAAWIDERPGLEGQEAVNAAQTMGWDLSVASLVAFPDVLQRMSENYRWTARLGQAYLEQEGDVIEAIQVLRGHAYRSGRLDDLDYAAVYQDNHYIIIEPHDYAHVYVPYYSHSVYGNWWWPDYPPYFWRAPTAFHSSGYFYWGSGYYVAPTFFYSNIHWHDRHVVLYDRNVYRPYSARSRHYNRYQGAERWVHNRSYRRDAPSYRHDGPRSVYLDHNRYDRDRHYGGVYPRGGSEQRNYNDSQKQIDRGNNRRHEDRGNVMEHPKTVNRNQNWQRGRSQDDSRTSAVRLRQENHPKEKGRELVVPQDPRQYYQSQLNNPRKANSLSHIDRPSPSTANGERVNKKGGYQGDGNRDERQKGQPAYKGAEISHQRQAEQFKSQPRAWKGNSQRTERVAGKPPRQETRQLGKAPYRVGDRGGKRGQDPRSVRRRD